MAVLCPIYDPLYGWYVIDQSGKKVLISSLLYYYYSLGVSPPVGAKITQTDIEEFENDLFVENDSEDEDNNYGNVDYPPNNSTNFLSNLSVLPPSVQFQPLPTALPLPLTSLTENVKQIPSTSAIGSYDNGPVGPLIPPIGYHPLSNNSLNQAVPMTDLNNSSILTAMLPFLTPTSIMSWNKEMETLNDEDEDEFDEDLFMYDSSSLQSPSNSDMS